MPDLLAYSMLCIDGLMLVLLICLAALVRSVDRIEERLLQYAPRGDIEHAHRRIDALAKLIKPFLKRRR